MFCTLWGFTSFLIAFIAIISYVCPGAAGVLTVAIFRAALIDGWVHTLGPAVVH